jgi:type 1 fimbriae regulatory protein FimB
MQHLTRSELLKLLDAAKAKSDRDWLMILVAFWHGLRASEVVGLTSKNIKDGYITVQRLKGSMKTVQPLIVHTDPLLNEKDGLEALAKYAGTERLFPITRNWFWAIVKKHGAEAGIPSHRVFPHALKHSIAMQTIKKGGIENVRQYLGHKSISSTGAYLKVSDEEASEAIALAAGV